MTENVRIETYWAVQVKKFTSSKVERIRKIKYLIFFSKKLANCFAIVARLFYYFMFNACLFMSAVKECFIST